jgi:hypothetical protein
LQLEPARLHVLDQGASAVLWPECRGVTLDHDLAPWLVNLVADACFRAQTGYEGWKQLGAAQADERPHAVIADRVAEVRSASTHAWACASLLSTSVPSTSSITPRIAIYATPHATALVGTVMFGEIS